MKPSSLISLISESTPFKELLNSKADRLSIKGLVGSSLSVILSALSLSKLDIHIVILDDKEAAAYLYNDLVNINGEPGVLFFPSAYKRSIIYGGEDSSALVQRMAVLSAIESKRERNLIICTYPEAVMERVVSSELLAINSIELSKGEKLSTDFLNQTLAEYGFNRVDFVYEPGQYAIRGSIIDIFSYSDNKPYRVDFFGNEIDSIRSFDINTQLSIDRLERVKIIPNLSGATEKRISFLEFVYGKNSESKLWINSLDALRSKIKSVRVKLIKESHENIERQLDVDIVTSGLESLENDVSKYHLRTLRDELDIKDRIVFNTTLQPVFNKNFELLYDNLAENTLIGYRNYIITENKAQVERLENIFHSIGKGDFYFENLSIDLHQGFICHDTKSCLYTDHQIFERFHRYQIKNELPKAESLTIAELGALSAGDYVVHLDHGIGRYAGIQRSIESGKVQEVVKIIYQNDDVLLVNVHSLHKISKYRDKDDGAPKINKLGSQIWQKLKNTTKSKVKDIAKDLIRLYAERVNSNGFAFSPDSYLQNELEASFIYEDTPDQHKVTEALKMDMQKSVPMDRLVCGDVGFGKTEIAIRAAFKAATDGKQVAVLVPTTVLALQHYRTFTRRLKDFPVRVEQLSRAKTAKQTTEILADLAAGKIDILIGTHKILSKSVKFKDLGLLVIDEEQKFGVSSKEKLRELRHNVDTLTLTATPIPRTLQFSLMGARDLSVINTPPPNRQPINTEVHQFNEDLIRDAITTEVERGGQLFFIHNRVQTIEHMEAIITRLCPDVKVVIGHGQMPPEKLEKVMMDFIYGEYDVLLATTIVESGIDISNANTMIINDAQNFGLSDLHQLRGRVGRTNRKAYCYLLTPPEESVSENARRRLRAIEDFSELGAGFNIAMQDLDIRGAGNILGAEQSGFISDIGFETYQKILNEAIMELQQENYMQVKDLIDMPKQEEAEQIYITDCQIDIDREAHIPDSYVSSSAEKIRLYREIDNIKEPSDMEELRKRLVDRFGQIPPQTEELLDVVLLRGRCITLGFEKAVVKNGYLILHFIFDHKSRYYTTPLFNNILKFISVQGENYKLKTKGEKVFISIAKVRDTAAAVVILDGMLAFAASLADTKSIS